MSYRWERRRQRRLRQTQGFGVLELVFLTASFASAIVVYRAFLFLNYLYAPRACNAQYGYLHVPAAGFPFSFHQMAFAMIAGFIGFGISIVIVRMHQIPRPGLKSQIPTMLFILLWGCWGWAQWGYYKVTDVVPPDAVISSPRPAPSAVHMELERRMIISKGEYPIDPYLPPIYACVWMTSGEITDPWYDMKPIMEAIEQGKNLEDLGYFDWWKEKHVPRNEVPFFRPQPPVKPRFPSRKATSEELAKARYVMEHSKSDLYDKKNPWIPDQ